MTRSVDRVVSTDGVSLAIYEAGPNDSPTVVAVHGYPDNHSMWDQLVPLLSDRFHVVTYDVRGTGASDKPERTSAYRIPQLVADLHAVVDATAAGAPVHLLGHDWGSVQSWAAVTDERFAGRIATFTSISGPSLDYAADWLRHFRRHRAPALRQLGHSFYVGLFQLPKLPEIAIRRGLLDRLIEDDADRGEADKINGLSLYRANVTGRLRRPAARRVRVPVQLIVPEQDAYVTPEFAIGAAEPWVDDLTVHRLPAGHWVVRQQPELVAPFVREFVQR